MASSPVASTGTNAGCRPGSRVGLNGGVALSGQEHDLDQPPPAGWVGGLQHERGPAHLHIEPGLFTDLASGTSGRTLPWPGMAAGKHPVAAAVTASSEQQHRVAAEHDRRAAQLHQRPVIVHARPLALEGPGEPRPYPSIVEVEAISVGDAVRASLIAAPIVPRYLATTAAGRRGHE